MRRQRGFTLIELLIVMAIFGMVMAGVVQMFTTTLTQFKQQGKIAESNIEGIIGLEMLRQDIEHAGFGLPWRVADTAAYAEAAGTDASAYNDAKSSSPMDPPRAFVVGDKAGWSGADVLVIKATNLAVSRASQKWTYIDQDLNPKTWGSDAEDLKGSDRVIVISPGTDDGNRRTLVGGAGWMAANYTAVLANPSFAPTAGYHLVYGIDDESLRMPFNRADYYVNRSETTPERCAPNTGVLMKGRINQSNGVRNPLPLLDCVADMQVVFRLDRDGDGNVDPGGTDVLNDAMTGKALTAEQIRNQVKEVRVYILAHEGQRDKAYRHPETEIRVGEPGIGGREFNIGGEVHYRWKLYTMIVKPKNLR